MTPPAIFRRSVELQRRECVKTDLPKVCIRHVPSSLALSRRRKEVEVDGRRCMLLLVLKRIFNVCESQKRTNNFEDMSINKE